VARWCLHAEARAPSGAPYAPTSSSRGTVDVLGADVTSVAGLGAASPDDRGADAVPGSPSARDSQCLVCDHRPACLWVSPLACSSACAGGRARLGTCLTKPRHTLSMMGGINSA
jgi:hypothetical protein